MVASNSVSACSNTPGTFTASTDKEQEDFAGAAIEHSKDSADAGILAWKALEKDKASAEARALDAEERARTTEVALEQAQKVALERLHKETERADRAEERAGKAEARADKAEERARKAEARADKAEERAGKAEARADKAEERAGKAEALADSAEPRMQGAEARARDAEARAVSVPVSPALASNAVDLTDSASSAQPPMPAPASASDAVDLTAHEMLIKERDTIVKERDAAVEARDRAVAQLAAERASASELTQTLRESLQAEDPKVSLEAALGKVASLGTSRPNGVTSLELTVKRVKELVQGANDAALTVKQEEHMLAVMFAARYARHGVGVSDRQQNEELRKVALELVKHATEQVATAKLAALRASAESQNLMKKSALSGVELEKTPAGQKANAMEAHNALAERVSEAMKAHIAANKVLKEAEDRQTELIAPVAERSMPAPRGSGHPKPDESEQATVKQAIRAAIDQVVLTAVREMRKAEEVAALSRELTNGNDAVTIDASSSSPRGKQQAAAPVTPTAHKKGRIMRTASNILTSAIGVNATGTMRGDRAANEREKAEPDEWDKAEIAWQEKSKEAEDFIAEAQKQLGAFQHSLSTARETLAVARKMATAEELEETFDPELDDATQTARSELHEIESTIRNSLERAQNARQNLSAASTRSRQSRRDRERGDKAAADVETDERQTETEKCQVQLDQVEKQLEKISRDLGSADGQWKLEDWLMSLQVQTSVSGHEKMTVLGLIANALQARRPADVSAFEHAKSLEDVEGLLLSSDLTRVLAQAIEDGVGKLREQKAATAQQLSDKFKNEEGAFSFSFGGLDTFFNGLEGLVGTPNASLREFMQLDHCGMLDSCEWFAVKNVGDVEFLGHKETDKWGKEYPATMSLIEWFIVVDPSEEGKRMVNEKLQAKDRKPIRNWPIEHDDVNRDRIQKPTTAVRRKEPLSTFMREATLRKIDKQLLDLRTDTLREEEVIGARLYTGPMVRKGTVLNLRRASLPFVLLLLLTLLVLSPLALPHVRSLSSTTPCCARRAKALQHS